MSSVISTYRPYVLSAVIFFLGYIAGEADGVWFLLIVAIFGGIAFYRHQRKTGAVRAPEDPVL